MFFILRLNKMLMKKMSNFKMADSRRKFNMATILNDKARIVGIWGCKKVLTV